MKNLILWYRSTFHTPSRMAMTSLLTLRFVAGLALTLHGWGKIQSPFTWMGESAPVPGFFQFLAAFSEFGGGIAWILGLLTPLASFGIFITMSVAVFTLVSRGDPFVASGGGGPSYELALLYWSIALFIMFNGPGRLSIDHKLVR